MLASGEVACPGVASGVVVTSADEAEEKADQGVDVILARPTTDPDDVHGMIAAVAVITEIGGATSHAAVVSRELDKVCVVGCGAGNLVDLAGKVVTVDANDGAIFEGSLEVVVPALATHPDLQVLSTWLQSSSANQYVGLKAVLATD
ncbi:PEP-utilizing enzyme [Mycolicibacterium sp. CH28]|uniref:PEP-utilizing enzyme n=1 Tax=Mycolicibacterium sp. CH28 TaxID=2512237 RepID=UPI001EEBC575|nr:PEP-utilizing enzyme [Mycolicibacterium sp. CH28]